MSGRPGGSAQAEYERRRARELEIGRRRWPIWVLITAITPVLMYTVVRVGVPWAYLQLMEVLTQDVEVEITPLDPGLINLAALLVAVGSTATVIRGFWGRRQSTEAWAKGAEGERRTAHTLHRLGSRYRVVHDLPMPRGGNIDHVVVGPTGVFTIETKHYSADVVISRHGVRAGRASMHRVVDQAQRQARAMSAWLGTDATPIVVIQGSAVRLSGWFTQPFVDGVRFCSGPKLRRTITRRRAVLDAEQVASLAARLPGGSTGSGSPRA